jgi:uncharacterized repeat protein (TIGR01451 family)
MSPVAGLVMVVAMLFGGLWMPAGAQEAIQAEASPTVTDEVPVVTPDVTVEPTTEPTVTQPETPVVTEAAATEEPVITEEPAVETPAPTATAPAKAAPARSAPQVNIAATGEVNFQVTTADGGSISAGFKICTWDPVNATQCSDADVSTWEVGIPEGEFDYWTEFQEPYLEIDVYDVPVAAGESLQIPIVLEMAELVDVTFDVSTSDGGAIPAGLEICVSDPVNGIDCSEAGATTWTVPVLSQGFNYWTHFTDPYIDVDVEGVTLPAGEPATITIVLEPEPVLETNITKVVSDSNPAPGAQITYTVHAWGTSPHNAVEINDFLPFELTNETFSCEIAAGAPQWSDSCDDWWIEGAGLVYGGIDPDDQGNYDVTFTVTATVPDEPGVQFINTACAFGERDMLRAEAAAGPIAGDECAAVTVVTQMETEDASITVNVTTEDGSEVPAGTIICVTDEAMAEPTCTAAGLSSATFAVAAGGVMYDVLGPGYAPVNGYTPVEAGDNAVVDVVLVAELESDIFITKTASDLNPEPGARISYEIHVWGTSPSLAPIEFVDILPAELSDVRVSCEIVTGWTHEPSCAYPLDGTIVGSIMPDDYNDDSDAFEMVVTVTGTVTSEPGVTFINLACAIATVELPPLTRTGVQAFAQPVPDGSLAGACDAATVTTQSDPEPAEGQWGAAAMTVDVTEARPGDPVTYTLTLPWEAVTPQVSRQGVMGFAQLAGPNFVIIDSVPRALTNVVWSCVAVNATCAPGNGTGYDVTAEGSVLDPARDALVTLTITGTVADDAPAGEVVNRACVTQEGEPECLQAPEASFMVLAQPVDPTVTPVPTEPGTPAPTGTVVPTDPAQPTATATATPAVTGLPSTGAAPGGHAISLALIALVAAALLAAGAMVLRGERARR